MKISYFKNKGNNIGWFILKALDTNLDRAEKLDGENLDVKLTIDGIEFNFIEVVNKMVDSYDRDVKEMAEHLLKEKMKSDVFNGLDEIINQSNILQEQIELKINKMWDI